MVDIDQRQPEPRSAPPRPRRSLLQEGVELAAIGDPGEAVAIGEILQAEIQLFQIPGALADQRVELEIPAAQRGEPPALAPDQRVDQDQAGQRDHGRHEPRALVPARDDLEGVRRGEDRRRVADAGAQVQGVSAGRQREEADAGLGADLGPRVVEAFQPELVAPVADRGEIGQREIELERGAGHQELGRPIERQQRRRLADPVQTHAVDAQGGAARRGVRARTRTAGSPEMADQGTVGRDQRIAAGQRQQVLERAVGGPRMQRHRPPSGGIPAIGGVIAVGPAIAVLIHRAAIDMAVVRPAGGIAHDAPILRDPAVARLLVLEAAQETCLLAFRPGGETFRDRLHSHLRRRPRASRSRLRDRASIVDGRAAARLPCRIAARVG